MLSLFGFFFNVFVFLLGMVNKWNTCIGATCCSCCRQLWHIHNQVSLFLTMKARQKYGTSCHEWVVILTFHHVPVELLAKEGANGNKRCCFWKNLNPKRFNLSLSCNFSQLGRHPVLCWQRRTPCMWNVSSGGSWRWFSHTFCKFLRVVYNIQCICHIFQLSLSAVLFVTGWYGCTCSGAIDIYSSVSTLPRRKTSQKDALPWHGRLRMHQRIYSFTTEPWVPARQGVTSVHLPSHKWKL